MLKARPKNVHFTYHIFYVIKYLFLSHAENTYYLPARLVSIHDNTLLLQEGSGVNRPCAVVCVVAFVLCIGAWFRIVQCFVLQKLAMKFSVLSYTMNTYIVVFGNCA